MSRGVVFRGGNAVSRQQPATAICCWESDCRSVFFEKIVSLYSLNPKNYVQMEIIDPQPTSGAASQTASTASASRPDAVKPDNYLAWAIVSTILCCLPFGIVAIVYASQVDTYWFAGDHEAARRSSKRARTWTWVSVGVAAFCWLVYLLLVFVFAAAVSLPLFDL